MTKNESIRTATALMEAAGDILLSAEKTVENWETCFSLVTSAYNVLLHVQHEVPIMPHCAEVIRSMSDMKDRAMQ
jgi:hypothetical protein